jgi:hypothetical protein
MIRIGVVNIDTSHPLAFSEILMKEKRARIVGVYNDGLRGDDEVELFISKFGLEKRCSGVEELAEIVDIGFIQGCNWNTHLDHVGAFFDRNKPVFIDKPIVGNIADCSKLLDYVKQGKVILGSSSLRYADEICNFVYRPIEDRGEIINVFGTCGMDEFNYGIHVVEAIGGFLGTGAQKAVYTGKGEVAGNICETYTISFVCGTTATYHTLQGGWLPCHFLVTTTTDVHCVPVDISKVYIPLLDRICDYMETGINTLADIDSLIESIKIMLAARLSRENNGGEVALDDIPINDPGFDGAAFSREYAAKAKKIYL